MDKSIVTIEVGLDEKRLPNKIEWFSSDAPADYPKQEAKAMFISFYDKPTSDTLKIDLWTTDMQVNEMDAFLYFTLRSLTETYYNATRNKDMAEEMHQFVQYFGEKTMVIKKNEK